MAERPEYTVHAVPDGKFWALRIHGLTEGVFSMSQALREKGERDIEDMARDFIALSLEVDENSFDLKIEIEEGKT